MIFIAGTPVHGQIGNPSEVLALAFWLRLPVFEHVHFQVLVGLVQRYALENAEAVMGAVAVRGFPVLNPGVALQLVEQRLVVARFRAEDEAHPMLAELADMRAIGGQSVLQHNERKVRVLPAHIGDEALRRLALTVVLGYAIRVLDWLGRQGKNLPVLGMHDHRRQHLVVILHAAIPVVLLAAVRTVDAAGGERSGAIDRKQVVTVPIRVLLQRLATL